MILDIYARRARTREGKLQVELAQLNYLLPRLSGKGTMLSRLGGGIGTRGPGETKLEMDRRRIRNRIALLRRDLETVRLHRQLRREKRKGIPIPVVRSWAIRMPASPRSLTLSQMPARSRAASS